MRLDVLSTLNAERAARRAAIVVTDIDSGAQRLVKADNVGGDPLAELIAERLRSGKSGMAETTQGRVFFTTYVPPPRLIAIGAVHISQALAPMARLLGYDVTVV